MVDYPEETASNSVTQAAVIMTYFAMALAVIHLNYMNLLINARFWLAIKCESVCMPCWQIQAYGCCLKWVTTGNNRPCRDKCFEAPTILKWIVYGALYGTLFFLVQQWNTE